MNDDIKDIFLREASERCGLSLEMLDLRVQEIEQFRLSLPQLCVWEQYLDRKLIDRWQDLSYEVRLHLVVEGELMIREKRYLCEYNDNEPKYEPGVPCKVCKRFMVDSDGKPNCPSP